MDCQRISSFLSISLLPPDTIEILILKTDTGNNILLSQQDLVIAQILIFVLCLIDYSGI